MTRMKRSLSWALALILSLSLLPLPLAHAADRPTVASSIMAQAAAPGKPVVNALSSVYGTGDRVVVSWSAASGATHYNLSVDMKKGDGTWQTNYKSYSYVKSPAHLEALPAGSYRLRVQAGNRNTSPVSYTYSDYQSFTVQANSLTVAFNPSGGAVSPASMLVKPYSTFVLPTPTRSKYAFVGWYAPAGNLINRTSKVGSVGITLTARWVSGGVGFTAQDIFRDNFRDVKATNWYYDSVASVYNYGLMSGTSATEFSPASQVTAAQAITMAARLHKIYTTGNGDFAASSPWYKSYTDYAQSQKIISSAPSSPNMALTRQEFAAILANALPDNALPQVNQIADGVLPDVSRSDTAIYKLYRAGILTGNDSKGTFLPNSSISRAEAAAILVRMADPNSRMLLTLS